VALVVALGAIRRVAHDSGDGISLRSTLSPERSIKLLLVTGSVKLSGTFAVFGVLVGPIAVLVGTWAAFKYRSGTRPPA
jgi:hypothetical protein